jgi:hypothetical protein
MQTLLLFKCSTQLDLQPLLRIAQTHAYRVRIGYKQLCIVAQPCHSIELHAIATEQDCLALSTVSHCFSEQLIMV